MDNQKLHHDIVNDIERLKIMLDLLMKNQFNEISKDEIKKDLKDSLLSLEKNFSCFF